MLLALKPCGLPAALCTGVVLLSFSCHHTAQIPLPLEEQHEGQKLSSQSWVSGLGVCFDKTHEGFARHQGHLYFAFACLSSLPPISFSNRSVGELWW